MEKHNLKAVYYKDFVHCYKILARISEDTPQRSRQHCKFRKKCIILLMTWLRSVQIKTTVGAQSICLVISKATM